MPGCHISNNTKMIYYSIFTLFTFLFKMQFLKRFPIGHAVGHYSFVLLKILWLSYSVMIKRSFGNSQTYSLIQCR